MSRLDHDAVEAGLARALADAGWPSARVTVTGVASAGANRRTFFVDIESEGPTCPAVAQLAELNLGGLSLTDEAAVVRLAARAGVPVAEPLAASDDPSYVGSSFQLSRRVEGITVPRHVLRAVADRPERGVALTRQCGSALAHLHAIDTEAVPDRVERFVEPSTSAAYWTRLHDLAALVPPSPATALGLRWLASHHPEPATRPALVHGDLRNGNLIVGDDGLSAVIDWELAHVGDPMEDLAWLCLRCWRFREDDREVGGFGDLADLAAAYEQGGGTWRHDAFRWWKVARTLWWSVVLSLQAGAFVAGTSSSLVLAASGRRAAELEYDLLMLIAPDRPGGTDAHPR
jgi:aminoglycoside phosphotransferase (APT) family kinase protein